MKKKLTQKQMRALRKSLTPPKEESAIFNFLLPHSLKMKLLSLKDEYNAANPKKRVSLARMIVVAIEEKYGRGE